MGPKPFRHSPERYATSMRIMVSFANRNRWRRGQSIKVVRFDDGYADPCLASLNRTHWGVRFNRLRLLRRRLEHWPEDARTIDWAGPMS